MATYNTDEQVKLAEAQELCAKIDYSITGKDYGISDYKLEDYNSLYGEAVRQETEKGTSTDEILEKLGNMVKETVDYYLGTEKSEAKGLKQVVCENTSFDFSVDENNGLSFELNSYGKEYSVNEDRSVQEAIGMAVRDNYDISSKMTISQAVSKCKETDIQLNEEPDSVAYYGEFADEEMRKGTPATEIVKQLGKAMEETLSIYLEVQCTAVAEEDYEKEVLAETYLETYEEEGDLKFVLNCNDRRFPVQDGDDIKDRIDSEIEAVKEEHEEEQEYDYD